MAEEIQEAVQIIRVAYDGIEIAMKVGSGGLSAMQKAVDLLKGMLDYEKSLGKTSMRKLLMRGGDLQVLQFADSDMKKVQKLAKKYGILYSVLPGAGREDGLTELVFHSEAVPRANMMLQRLGSGRITTFDDYLKDGDDKQLAKLMDFLQGQKSGNARTASADAHLGDEAIDSLMEKVGRYAMEKQGISEDAVRENFSVSGDTARDVLHRLENMGLLDKPDGQGFRRVIMDREAFENRVRGYRDLADRIRTVSAAKNPNLSDVTIARSLIREENDHAVKTRVPGTWGENVRYVWLRRENIMEIHNGKTLLTFLDGTKDYKLYDEQNRVVETKKGDELYLHYDVVESSVRQRYEQMQRKSIDRERGRKAAEQARKASESAQRRR